ncbi:uncharacterized protein [Amphiura filiformis]|uniref:uncharacterized protein isoform X2 n=1 Tax=Amphiura filiformis TaxID=82378 RepID=UPI003B213198
MSGRIDLFEDPKPKKDEVLPVSETVPLSEPLRSSDQDPLPQRKRHRGVWLVFITLIAVTCIVAVVVPLVCGCGTKNTAAADRGRSSKHKSFSTSSAKDINECSSDPCQNGGTCMDSVNEYSCSCLAGYVGVHCEIDINECSSDPCQNGGTCTDSVNGYSCSCLAGYVGVHCEVDINECSSGHCQNGGTCMDNVNGYSCSCLAGYVGVHCEIDFDECSSDPCQNGGKCVEGVASYICHCLPGYVGVHCTDIDECSSGACLNGGTCENLVNGFSCKCVIGYVDAHCETAICTKGCEIGGTCTAPDTCTCLPCYTGTMCESVVSGIPGPLGLEDGSVTDNQFTASSTWAFGDIAPYKGRLNYTGFWAAASRSLPCWLQVDFLSPVVITGIKTQGAPTVDQWIKTFQVKFGSDVNALKDYTLSNVTVTFNANTDRTTVVENAINQVIARYFRVMILTFQWHPAMRMEVIGYRCNTTIV